MSSDDFLWHNLRDLPAFRALLRAVEARLYQDLLPLDEPVLDVGCGDGHFASVTFPRPLAAGVDPAFAGLREARGRAGYRIVAQARGSALPFPSGEFRTVISNSALEHIPEVEAVLGEIARVLRGPEPGKRGGRLLFSVPSDHFSEFLYFPLIFRRLRLRGPAHFYESFINRRAGHHHCDGPEVWRARLAAAGLRTCRSTYYFSEQAHRTLDQAHYWGLPNLLAKRLLGRWILFPSRRNPLLDLTERRLRPLYEEALPPIGAYLFVVAERT